MSNKILLIKCNPQMVKLRNRDSWTIQSLFFGSTINQEICHLITVQLKENNVMERPLGKREEELAK